MRRLVKCRALSKKKEKKITLNNFKAIYDQMCFVNTKHALTYIFHRYKLESLRHHLQMNSHGNIRKWLSSFWYFVRLIMYALAGIKFQMMFLLCMMNPTVLLTWTSRGSNESGHILKRRINETLVLCQILSSLKLQKGSTIKTFQISVANCHFLFHFCQNGLKWAILRE